MRKEEAVRLYIEQTHKNGTVTTDWHPYKVKVDYDAWIKATRTNMLERGGEDILLEEREGVIVWRRDPEPPSDDKPRSNSLY
jgi:hypothetical protein